MMSLLYLFVDVCAPSVLSKLSSLIIFEAASEFLLFLGRRPSLLMIEHSFLNLDMHHSH